MAMKTVLGLFENKRRAEDAAQSLKHEGFASSDIHMKAYDEYAGKEYAKEHEESALQSFLRDIGLMGPDRTADTSRSEETLLMVDADDVRADHAADILNRHGAMDIDERMAGHKETHAAKTGAPEHGKVEEMEEELKIGTRPVSRGGVRIYTRPTERTVEEPVTLHEEELHVERHPVDRPATGKEAAFKEESFEVRAKGEEPVVGKEARVKEEVTVSKTAGERKETIHETLRGTKVEVQQLSPEAESEFKSAESEFHSDYDRMYSGTGAKYEDVLPAYRYGYSLGRDPFYRGDDWRDVEPKVRKDWDDHNYEGWDFYAKAVHKGWEQAARRH